MRMVSLLIWALVIALLLSPSLVAAQTTNFITDLSGIEEVPPVETVATGQATFQVNPDSSELTFTLTVANIENVLASHIHCASVDENGAVGATLSGGAPGPVNGILAQGTITAPDQGNVCGWANLAALVEGMRSGNTYVNVHTAANPSGEIRGQIR